VPEASQTLPCDPSSVPAARHFVQRTLTAWGEDDAGWAASQIVSELASNCALHARTDFDVRLVQQEGRLRLEVRDSSPGRVQQRRYSNESTTGRGLRLVDDLAGSWGVELHDGGKTVWVALRTEAVLSDAGDLDDDVDLDVLLASFGDDDAGQAEQPPSRPGSQGLRVAA
jgi:anti-sigma regulatory factor (Ser/Thr protein kinase)